MEYISDKETITTLINNFRNALVKIVPNFEEVGIKWKDYLENESVETVVEAIYTALVVDKLNFIMGNNDKMKELAGYGMFYKNYLKHNFIRVIDKDTPDIVYAFSYLTSVKEAFDSVNCNIVSSSLKVEGEIILPFENLEFII